MSNSKFSATQILDLPTNIALLAMLSNSIIPVKKLLEPKATVAITKSQRIILERSNGEYRD